MKHITVLQQEATHALNLSQDSAVVDCTFGSAGHAESILAKLGKKGVYVGIDADETALKPYKEMQSSYDATIHLVHDNFRDIQAILQKLDIDTVDAVLADLGWRMEQFDGSSGLPRGFSFRADEPLAMTFGSPKQYAFTAYDIVNEWDEEDIANVLYGYGQERYSRRIAKGIVTYRVKNPITTSLCLAEIIKKAVPVVYRHKKTHPATKSFQALRIAVNDEFDALQELLLKGFEALKVGGRMTIITFHSLEDRIVKETFKTYVRDQKGVLVTKKPVVPSEEEQQTNPRARSAKMRTIEKL